MDKTNQAEEKLGQIKVGGGAEDGKNIQTESRVPNGSGGGGQIRGHV